MFSHLTEIVAMTPTFFFLGRAKAESPIFFIRFNCISEPRPRGLLTDNAPDQEEEVVFSHLFRSSIDHPTEVVSFLPRHPSQSLLIGPFPSASTLAV